MPLLSCMMIQAEIQAAWILGLGSNVWMEPNEYNDITSKSAKRLMTFATHSVPFASLETVMT